MKAIISFFIFVSTLIVICIFLGCSQQYHCSKCLTPPIVKDSLKQDTTVKFIPQLFIVKGDTIHSTKYLTRPCPDSLKAWEIYNIQVNGLLNQSNRINQKISFEIDSISYQLRIQNDSVEYYKEMYTVTIEKERTLVDQFYKSGYEVQKQKLKTYLLVIISESLIILILISIIALLVFKR